MLTKSKIALSLAFALGSVSVAIAAPNHAVRHWHVPAAAYQSFALKPYPVILQQGFGSSASQASQLGPTDPTNGIAR
jgi:hypothetical protein